MERRDIQPGLINSFKKLQVIILSYERPCYLREALNSVLRQDLGRDLFEVIVSDNSKSTRVNVLMRREFPHINLIRRIPSVNPYDHFRKVAQEVTADFVVLFHDDDIMHPSYCTSVLEVLEAESDVMAVATNGIIIDSKSKGELLFNQHASRQTFSDKASFLSNYIEGSPNSGGIMPFPAYCYRRRALLIPERPIAGPYTDVVILSAVFELGKIVWLPVPLISYRIHGQESTVLNIRAFSKLCRFYRNNGISRDSPSFRQFRKVYWFLWYLRLKGVVRLRLYFLSSLPVPSSWLEARIHRACLFPPDPRLHSKQVIPKILGVVWRFCALFNMGLGYSLYVIRKFRKEARIWNW